MYNSLSEAERNLSRSSAGGFVRGTPSYSRLHSPSRLLSSNGIVSIDVLWLIVNTDNEDISSIREGTARSLE